MERISVSRFYNYEEMTQVLHGLAESFPDLITLSSIAQTPEGRQVWCVQVTNGKASRPMEGRPGFLISGNMHAIELAGSCASLYFLKFLLQGYERDPEIRALLGEQIFYIIPRLAVDGVEYVLETLNEVRSKPISIKEPNVPYPQDLDGDGKILYMRWQCPDGRYKASEKDPRLMIPREIGDSEGPFYNVCREGLIHQWDGKTIGTSKALGDFNRNFPANWIPMPDRIGQGPYPLSEPETKGLADFVLAHPNIVNAVDFHTGNSAVFVPSGVVKGRAKFAQDEALFYSLGQLAQEMTGFPLLGGYDEISTGLPTKGLPGSYKDWLYEHRGITAFIIELGDFHNFLGISTQEYCSYKNVTEREERLGLVLLKWHDENPEGGLFFDWKPFQHPQLGNVEIGGWNWALWRNPPLTMMEEVCHNSVLFLIKHASYVPDVSIRNFSCQRLGENIFKVALDVVNQGKVATNINRQGLDARPFSGLLLELDGPESMEFIIGKARQDLGHLPAFRGKASLEWVIRTPDGTLSATLRSERGIFVNESLALNGSLK